MGQLTGRTFVLEAQNICRTPIGIEKSYNSVVALAVCDHRCRFTYAAAGFVGCMYDARIYRLCGLQEKVQQLSPDELIVGDSAFPLSLGLMKPYRDNTTLSQQQRRFNYKLSSTRMPSEHAFGCLKGKMRRLKELEMSDIPYMTRVLLSSKSLLTLAFCSVSLYLQFYWRYTI